MTANFQQSEVYPIGMRKRAKILLMQMAKQGGVFGMLASRRRKSVPILCYHGAWGLDDGFRGDAMFMHARTFEARMQLIARLGLKVITLDQASAALKGEAQVPENSVVITIDDGWYSTYRYMMPSLLKHGYPATLYCDTAQLRRGGVVPHVMARYVLELSGVETLPPNAQQAYDIAVAKTNDHDVRVGALHDFARLIDFDLTPYLDNRVFEYMSEAELRAFSDSGLDVQLHTHNHTMGDLSVDFVLREVTANAAALADILGRDMTTFKHFCYPSGVSDPTIAEELLGEGIESATTTVADVATPQMHQGLLPRIIDSEKLTEIELEAEIAGFTATLRRPFASA